MLKSFDKFSKSISNNIITYKILIEDLEKLYKYFHVSLNLLINVNDDNKTFIFTAKVPSEPFTDDDGSIVEDDFTDRVSLASDVESCLTALPEKSGGNKLYLYGVDLKNDHSDDIETLSLKKMIDKCPVINGKKYGQDFNLLDWLNSLSKTDYNIIKKVKYDEMIQDLPDLKNELSYEDFVFTDFITAPSDLPDKYKNLFYACVPDADYTNEFWSLKNLKMDYLGEFKSIHDKYVTLRAKKDNDIPPVIKNLINNK